MVRRGYRANQVVSDAVSDRVDEFESPVLENWMHTVDDGDELVHHYAEAIASAQYAADETDERYGWRDDLHTITDEAVEALEAAFEDHLDVLVAEVCATVANREGVWIEHADDEDVEPAVHEAREWLQAHEAAARRADVWDEVTA
ncbi:hypothetical protein [Natrinema pallidum]|uniref:Uncharacterized protein n=1 Tax=Natrinema pallidum TaxID=69527 RepID=A0A4V1IF32_9EURY|nr:hypothetical protein [Natrinema pallidum]QCW03584.1 hypothetical protein FGF80_10170 [Natrinema pallidum]